MQFKVWKIRPWFWIVLFASFWCFRGVAEKLISLVNFHIITIISLAWLQWLDSLSIVRPWVADRFIVWWRAARSIFNRRSILATDFSALPVSCVTVFSRVHQARLTDVDIITVVSLSVKTFAEPYRLWIQWSIFTTAQSGESIDRLLP